MTLVVRQEGRCGLSGHTTPSYAKATADGKVIRLRRRVRRPKTRKIGTVFVLALDRILAIKVTQLCL